MITRTSLTYALLPILLLLPRHALADVPYNPFANAWNDGTSKIGSIKTAVQTNSRLNGIEDTLGGVGNKIASKWDSLPLVSGLKADAAYIQSDIDEDAASFGAEHPNLTPAVAWAHISSKFGALSTIGDAHSRDRVKSELSEQYMSIYSAAGTPTSPTPGKQTPAPYPGHHTPMQTPAGKVTVTVTVSSCPKASPPPPPPPPPPKVTPTKQTPTSRYTPPTTYAPPPMPSTPPTPGAPGGANAPPTQYTGGAGGPKATGVNFGALFGLAGFMGFWGAM